MKYKPFKKPKIMQAKVQTKYGKSIDHPQIVLGRAGKEYVSVSCTHSSHVKGKHVHHIDNVSVSYGLLNLCFNTSTICWAGLNIKGTQLKLEDLVKINILVNIGRWFI